MCIHNSINEQEKNEWLSTKPEIIRVWKMVEVSNEHYINAYSCCVSVPKYTYLSGLNASPKGPGFHFFTKKIDSERHASFYYEHIVLECFIYKNDIQEIGLFGLSDSETVVTTCAIFPRFPERVARYEDLPITDTVLIAEGIKK